MDVEVKDRLSGSSAVVDHGSVANGFDPALASECTGKPEEMSDHPLVFGFHAAQGLDMGARQYQQVHRRLRMQILDRYRRLVFVDEPGGRFTPDDLAEDAVFQTNPPFALDR